MNTEKRFALLDENLIATGYGAVIATEGLKGLCFVIRTIAGTTNLTASIVGANDPDLDEENWTTFQEFNDGDAITTGDDEHTILSSVDNAPMFQYFRVKATITNGGLSAEKSQAWGHF